MELFYYVAYTMIAATICLCGLGCFVIGKSIRDMMRN